MVRCNMSTYNYERLDYEILRFLGEVKEPLTSGDIRDMKIMVEHARCRDRRNLQPVVYERLELLQERGLVVTEGAGWKLWSPPAPAAPAAQPGPIETHGITREEFVKVMAILAPLVVDEGQGTHVVRNGSPREITAAIYEIAKRIRDSRAPRGEPYGWVVGGSERRRAETLYAQEPNAALLARMDVRHPERAPHLATPLALYYSGEGL